MHTWNLIILYRSILYYSLSILLFLPILSPSVEYLLMFLLAICIFSLEQCQFHIPQFLTVLFLLLLLVYRYPFLILDISPFPEIWLANVFSSIIGCFYTCWFFLYCEKKKNLFGLMYSFVYFYFVACSFGIMSQNALLTPMQWSPHLGFSFKSLQICTVHLGLWSTLNWLLHGVWGKGWESFFSHSLYSQHIC